MLTEKVEVQMTEHVQNPYSSPAALTTDGEIELAAHQEFLVLGNQLFCRSKVDLSEYCFTTGDKKREVVKSVRLNGAPAIYQSVYVAFHLTWMLALFTGVLGPASPALAIGTSLQLILMIAIHKLYFIKIKVAFTNAVAWRNFRIDLEQAGLVFVLLLVSIGLGFILGHVVPQTPITLGFTFIFFIGSVLIIHNCFGARHSRLSATRIGVNLFRVDNLPSELLTKLRETSGADEPTS